MKPGIGTKFQQGILLALAETTDEYLIGTPSGVVKKLDRETNDT